MALTSKDGKFSCTPEHAVEVAYLISTAEGVLARFDSPFALERTSVLGVIEDYVLGASSIEECLAQLNEIAEED
ncbi:hypothetical protein [Methylobacterium sp. 285MFTsu5.1]|uniref:hypothetical protein n=1 Tax=Methylobacterium sp. 285MFTsu5.1 TaxID=1172187 RepID=UPI00036286BF|nr:hypothetical protein [Methylobacterium sp. 285MFTsu5.1]